MLAAFSGVALYEPMAARAQTPAAPAAPPPANPLLRFQPPQQPTVTPPRPEEGPQAPAEAGAPVHIISIEVDGATVYPAAELMAMLKGLQDATVPRSQVADAVREIQTKYRRDGYFLTAVRGILDPASGGMKLRVQVTEGYINSIKIEGDVGPVETLIYRYLDHLTEIRPVRFADVERYALLAENVSGMTVRTILRRPENAEPGAIDIVAQVQRKAFDGLITDDNRGPPFAGTDEVLIAVASNSFTSLGERLQATLYDTPLNAHQVFGQLSLEGFVGSEGLKLKGYVGSGTSTPGQPLAAEGFMSDLLEVGASATYPVIRTRALSLSLSAAFDVEESIIDVSANNMPAPTSKTNLRVVRLGEMLDVQDDIFGAGRAGANSVSFTVHRGIPELGGQSNNAVFVPRPGVRNDFTKYTIELVRVQDLYAWSTYSLALKLAFSGQETPDILPPIEKFFLGGEQYGRGFYSGEVTGDKVAAGTVELQFNDSFALHGLNIGTQYYTFYDTGEAWSNAPGDPSQHVESMGLGVRANLTPSLSAQVEGVDRFTRRPTSAAGSLEDQLAAFFRITARF